MRKYGILAFLGLAGLASASCPVYVSSGERYDTLPGGAVALTRNSTVLLKSGSPAKAAARDTVSLSTPAAFKAWLQASLADSALVFMARIDSLIEKENGGDTTVAGLSVAYTLNPADTLASGAKGFPFYARLQIDTVVRGTLSARSLWIKGYKANGCIYSYGHYQGLRFLNFSSGFSTMKNLKLPGISFYIGESPQSIVPDAEWFDGRYLVSPKFPGLRMNITEVLPAYPVTIVSPRGSAKPLTVTGKAYQPDGRRLREGAARKTSLPAFKRP